MLFRSYTYTTTNAIGCDSFAIVNLTVNSTSSSNANVTRCSNQVPYNWNGTNYSTTGSYTYTTENAVGCDSVAVLNLTVNSTSSSDTTASVCTSFSWHGKTYYTSGDKYDTLTNESGCDSVITLHLTIRATSASDTTASACTSFA